MKPQAKFIQKQCHFCSQNIAHPDYKDTETLKRFVSGQSKIIRPKFTNVCAKHQRRLALAIKRARFLALLPFTNSVR
ncbi:MAG: 30S ribosomal protein S18 [Candidatus Harrisonbacteria bacterium CG10_big_fil_rev_8_21_14_0_10_49_15]|uniref:Small ribosomal subunit protein bS18 n=1 Tax=Candidatus Harrisonbacteria bacterium CG10_big_fil_rev_8_21_14_0_10_49_15 TaxID=1974587 RepID=A0A2H0ULR2_9BACT|nr:MAG: 30S ribosomal protein S18 [Candidatus Harrisonbacteria bacterium CG10_big_fil_rev_8_21_14_0_10_49_15]